MGSHYHIDVQGSGACSCEDSETVLAAMMRAGIAEGCKGCRGGGCGVCRVRVCSGHYRVGKMGRNHVSEPEQSEGFALACRLYPDSDLVIATAHKQKSANNK